MRITEAVLDDIVSKGVAQDVFRAGQARLLLEDLDQFVEIINQTGVGKLFFANLQFILRDDLILSLSRLYEKQTSRNPGRSLPAAAHHIATYASELRLLNKRSLIEFLTNRFASRQDIEKLSDEQLSLALSKHLDMYMPRADSNSSRPLDQAFQHLQTVRDKAIAHHDRVSQSSLLIPAWDQLVFLIDSAREIVELLAHAYLGGSYDLATDAGKAARSLRSLLNRIGPGQNLNLKDGADG